MPLIAVPKSPAPTVIVCNSRAERGPLESVIDAISDVAVIGIDVSLHTPAEGVATALKNFTIWFEGMKPRRVIVLGDRYETLGAALAATFLKIPVAHIHGGETTEGAFDDALRHSITHLADLHFCATYQFCNKVIKLGKPPATVHCVGAPGLDGVDGGTAKRITDEILVTFHPETRSPDNGLSVCNAMLSALSDVSGMKIFCGVNTDPGSYEITKAIQNFCQWHGGLVREDFDHADYVALMQRAKLVVGNSSAGIIEAPWVGIPSVNIGERQRGRPLANSVVQWSGYNDGLLYAAFIKAMNFDGEIKPEYRGGAAPKIAEILARVDGAV